MRRHASLLAIIVVTVIAQTGTLHGAGSTISGAVKIMGLASNADAVVYIQEAQGTFPATKPVEMDQRGNKFIPHVLPVVVGTTVRFLNGDPTAHNVFSPDYEKYDLGNWSQGANKEYAFKECAQAPCVYSQLCKIHPQMDAYVTVLQNPYFAVTDKDGRFTIADVPPGSYTIGVWYPRRYKAPPQPVTVDGGAPATVDFVLAR